MTYECHVKVYLVCYDGAASLGKWLTYPRVPVAGDYLMVGPNEWGGFVQRVELVPASDEYDPTAWVHLEKRVEDDPDYMDDDVYDGYRRCNLREAMEDYIDEGFEVELVETVWLDSKCCPGWHSASWAPWHCLLGGLDPE